MSLRSLLKEGRLSREATSPDEIARLVDCADHFLRNACVPNLESTARFVFLHGAALNLALIVVRAAGYRPRGPGHHETTFAALGESSGREGAAWSAYLQASRRKRNRVSYLQWIDIPDSETDEFLAKIPKLREFALTRVAKSRPGLLAKVRK